VGDFASLYLKNEKLNFLTEIVHLKAEENNISLGEGIDRKPGQ